MRAARFALVIVLFSAPVMAQTIAQTANHKAWQDQMDGRLTWTNQACGTSITGPMNYATFDAVPDIGQKIPVGQACGEAADGITNLCKGPPAYKAAIAKGINKIVCSYGGPGKRSVSISGGTLSYSIDFPGKYDTDGTHFVQYYIANHL
jgi:hypothetical protein